MNKQKISILGSTGSVGQSTLDVIALHPNAFEVVALTAHTNVQTMYEQCVRFKPLKAVMVDSSSAELLAKQLKAQGLGDIQVEEGANAVPAVAGQQGVDAVMSAIVGAAGLLPTLAAVSAGKRVLIANKEPLVMSGDLFLKTAAQSGAIILPIDSEHNAIFQCLPDDQSKAAVKKIHLTASGGPFRGRVWNELKDITPAQACAHPNWSMGQKISVDSATMMNKGLELIEATALFGLPAQQVEIIVHPQSIIHSLVEYTDGSFLAQLGAPDMKIPIAHALSWPDRISSGAKTLDLTEIAQLDFHKPDMSNMPCLALARAAAEQGGAAPAILNAANECAVDAFMQEVIRFTEIPKVIEECMNNVSGRSIDSVDAVLQIDNEARAVAARHINSLASRPRP